MAALEKNNAREKKAGREERGTGLKQEKEAAKKNKAAGATTAGKRHNPSRPQANVL
jgi:hypothetical protein